MPGRKKWKVIYLVEIYRMVRAGLADMEICKTLNITRQALLYWKNKYPEVQAAVKLAERDRQNTNSLKDWIWKRLSESAQIAYDKIQKAITEKNGVALIELILQDHGKAVRQELFLHELIQNNYSASIACQKVNISKKTLDRWINEDRDFSLLVEEIEWHKANYFEEKLVSLVSEGNPAAVIFANKTHNSKRGYGSKSTLDVNISGAVMVGVMDLNELSPYLSVEVHGAIMDAMRKRDEALEQQKKLSLAMADPAKVIDSEIATLSQERESA